MNTLIRNHAHRLGVAGFTFFFIKGMLWLIVPLLVKAWL